MSYLMKSVALAALLASSGAMYAQETATPADPTPDESATPGEEPSASQDSADEATGTDDATTETEAETGLSMGEEVQDDEAVGRTYTKATFEDWEQRCIRTEDGADPCQLYQLLEDEGGNAVAEMSIFELPEGQQAAAGSTIITPLETLLTRQVTLAVDGGDPKRYPFDFCAQQGCFARIGLTDAEVSTFKRGTAARLTIVPAAAPDQEIQLEISLRGFTAGYDAVASDNAE